MRRSLGIPILLLWAAAPPLVPSSVLAIPQGDPAAYVASMQSADSLAEERKVEAAAEVYSQAVNTAPSGGERVEARLAWAGLLSRNPGEGKEATLRTAKAEELYRSAIAEAEGDLRLKAYNDFGVFLLRRGQAVQAAATLNEIRGAPWQGEDGPELHARYLYNLGQAQEHSRRETDAYPNYLEAMRLDPGFTAAREAASRLASRPLQAGLQGPSDPSLPLTKELLDQGHLAEAERALRLVTDSPGRLGAQDSEPFVDLMLRYLTEAQIDSDRFAQSWEGSFKNLEGTLPPPAAKRLGEVRDAYLAELAVELRPRAATATFSGWSDAHRVRPFSNFLKMVGDTYAKQGKLHRSLERYSQAASLDPTNSKAKLYLTNLLVAYPEQLDSEGRLLARWLEEGGADVQQASDPQEFKNHVYLHSLLGNYFERQKRWGPEEDAGTALFHWRQALEIQEKFSATEPSPLLHERLGGAYKSFGNEEMAVREYDAAVAGYQSQGNARKAREILGYIPTPDRDADSVVASENTGDSDESAADTEVLTGTASPWPLVGLIGLLSLAAAIGINILRRRSVSSRL